MNNTTPAVAPLAPLASLGDLPDTCPSCGEPRFGPGGDNFTAVAPVLRYRPASSTAAYETRYETDPDNYSFSEIDHQREAEAQPARLFCTLCSFYFTLTDDLIYEIMLAE